MLAYQWTNGESYRRARALVQNQNVTNDGTEGNQANLPLQESPD